MTIDWKSVERVLVIRLRSIGDTVLSTPSLIALRRFLPEAEIDVMLEDWVAPLLDGFEHVDRIITIDRRKSRYTAAWEIRRRRYDVVFNLHGGTTATFLTFASGGRHRIGYRNYQYSFLHNHLLSSPDEFWRRARSHSAEQQLALLGFVGVPVEDRPRSYLSIVDAAMSSLDTKCRERTGVSIDELGVFALIHPAASFATKEWPTENFSRVADYLAGRQMATVAIASRDERSILEDMASTWNGQIHWFDDLTLPEITALASRARLFVGNDSGIAHIAAAVGRPSVVIFGSSNRDSWRPWTDARNEIVFEEFHCQPCPGYECKEFGDSRCIKSVTVESVTAAIDRVLTDR